MIVSALFEIAGTVATAEFHGRHATVQTFDSEVLIQFPNKDGVCIASTSEFLKTDKIRTVTLHNASVTITRED